MNQDTKGRNEYMRSAPGTETITTAPSREPRLSLLSVIRDEQMDNPQGEDGRGREVPRKR